MDKVIPIEALLKMVKIISGGKGSKYQAVHLGSLFNDFKTIVVPIEIAKGNIVVESVEDFRAPHDKEYYPLKLDDVQEWSTYESLRAFSIYYRVKDDKFILYAEMSKSKGFMCEHPSHRKFDAVLIPTDEIIQRLLKAKSSTVEHQYNQHLRELFNESEMLRQQRWMDAMSKKLLAKA